MENTSTHVETLKAIGARTENSIYVTLLVYFLQVCSFLYLSFIVMLYFVFCSYFKDFNTFFVDNRLINN